MNDVLIRLKFYYSTVLRHPKTHYHRHFYHHHLAAITFIQPMEKKADAKEGDSLTLKCEVSKERARVQWFRNGEKIKPGKDYKTSISGSMRLLTIKKVNFEKENGAQYTCRIVENDEVTESTTKIFFPEASKFCLLYNYTRY